MTSTQFPSGELVCRTKNPLDWTPEQIQQMVDACREFAIFHQEHSPEIAHIYKKRGFDPRSLKTEADLPRIPSIGVTAMKYYLLTSLSHELTVLRLTSSGTRGQKTQIWFDQPSLDRVQAQLRRLWEQEGLVSTKLTNYVLFVYDPREAGDLGIAFSDNNQKQFAPVADTFYTIQKGAAGLWEFKVDETIAALQKFASDGKPVRLFGMPSFLHELLQAMIKRNIRVQLPAESMVMTGGGWKAAEDKMITREDFRRELTDRLGIPSDWIRDGYGMAEHCAPYMECKEHRFHIPVFTRIFIRNPETMELVPNGEVGLMELVTPFNAMMPNLSILTTDLGKIDAEKCPCGWNAPTFTLIGRGGISKHKGCAITASEIVKRS